MGYLVKPNGSESLVSDFDLAVSAFCLFYSLPDKDEVPMFSRKAYMCKYSTMILSVPDLYSIVLEFKL
jgi:hypothetical protein